MSISDPAIDDLTRKAIRFFWTSRSAAAVRQQEGARGDRGERAGVLAGRNMDGFLPLIEHTVKQSGVVGAEVRAVRSRVCLPGLFRSSKLWDVVITVDDQIAAVIEFKSQAGPSFGNNFKALFSLQVGKLRA